MMADGVRWKELGQKIAVDIPTGQASMWISASSFDNLLLQIEAMASDECVIRSAISAQTTANTSPVKAFLFFFFFRQALHLRVTCCPPISRGTAGARGETDDIHALSQTRVCAFAAIPCRQLV